ncbi:MAG: metallo-phosphoesterase [Wendovervirus sonii]|uniref:Metallo-phosphoesterase n=1 Tax=phage Lak_Megaphage_Sonny TaxID=3109229 RepID=A0ABZ0Z6A7_9CAUD|nr:MAG: metallo-phosphoesterase [phage Lak_Megaphage_Sonny]
MKIAAWSDGHGILPTISKDTDVIIIAGDLMPLDIQRNTNDSIEWLKNTFFPYIEKLSCKKVFMVPGNHDFIFERLLKGEFSKIIKEHNLEDKLIYLEDELYEYEGIKFYGCPWCTGPMGWAFTDSWRNPQVTEKYNSIPEDCDILITHQPPKVDKVGCSNPYQPYERDFGSNRLKNVIESRHIKLAFCGHIHTGIHNGIKFGDTTIYNVSLLNEDYNLAFEVTTVEI